MFLDIVIVIVVVVVVVVAVDVAWKNSAPIQPPAPPQGWRGNNPSMSGSSSTTNSMSAMLTLQEDIGTSLRFQQLEEEESFLQSGSRWLWSMLLTTDFFMDATRQ
jgi:hypothetical protein